MPKVIKSGVREMILKVKDFIMKEKQSDFPIIPLEKVNERVAAATGIQDGWVRVGPKNYLFPVPYVKDAEKIYNFSVRSDDVWVVSFPKSGTTVMQELVWMVANDCDYETSANKYLFERFPFIEMGMFVNSDKKVNLMKEVIATGDKNLIQRAEGVFRSHVSYAEDMPSPQFIKSHLPLSLLPPTLLDTCKVVHIVRDPRDVAVSYFHHSRFFRITGFTGTFKQFWNLFIQDKIESTPYFEMVKEWWAKKDHPNLLFLFYEDLIRDMPTEIRKVAKFLGKTMTDEQVNRLSAHLRFDNFKKNKSLNYELLKEISMAVPSLSFVRKGKSGDWQDHFDEEMNEQAAHWIKKNLQGCDLKFPSMGL